MTFASKFIILVLGGAAASIVGIRTPAHAQHDAPPELRKGSEADHALADAALCVVKGARGNSAIILEMEPQTDATGKAIVDLLRSAPFCVPSMTMMKAPSVTWRGAIAEALYARTFRAAPAPAPVETSDRPGWLSMPNLAAYAVAQCAVDRAPALADRLVRAKRRSPEEAAAVNALLPVLRGCGNGKKVDFDRVTIHGMVAEGLLRARGGTALVVGKQ